MSSRYFPVSLDVVSRRCVVIGGGHEALKKTRSLLEAGAYAHVVSPDLLPGLEALVAAKAVTLARRPYAAGDLEGAFLAFACTDDEAVNGRIAGEARAGRVLLNVVDRPARCDFIMPAVVRQGSLTFAITTDGKSPAFAKRLQQEVGEQYGQAYAQFLDVMGSLRPVVMEAGLPLAERSELFSQIVASAALDRLQCGDRAGLLAIVIPMLKEKGVPWPSEWSTWLEPVPEIPI